MSSKTAKSVRVIRGESPKLHRPVFVGIHMVLALVGGFLLGWFPKWAGDLVLHPDLSDVPANQDLERRNRLLQTELAVAEATVNELRAQAQSQAQEMGTVQKELDFYQDLLSESGLAKGLDVHELVLLDSGLDNGYHFVLTLSQDLKQAKIIEGQLNLQAEGFAAGEPATLSHEELLPWQEGEPVLFRFKYFQQLEGDLLLPENFDPQALIVSLDPKTGSNVERRFAWSELIN